MSGKFFDEWVIGEEYMTPSRTITETDVVMFAAMSGDYNELHTSEEFMKNSQFGRRIVHGLLGLAISHGLLFRTGLTEGTAIAFLGVESWKFEAPIFFGDTTLSVLLGYFAAVGGILLCFYLLPIQMEGWNNDKTRWLYKYLETKPPFL